MNISIILPSLNPDEKLLKVVNGLIDKGFDDIIIVNDGSDKDHLTPFLTAEKLNQCTVLTHDVNKGKGRALKTAFEYFLENRQGKDGVITVDGDNQHQPDDIYACGEAMLSNPHNIILGARDFSQSDVPARSKFGNKLTSFIFKTACGLNISDTQTGLRAIPTEHLKLFISADGERFEYETNMLLEMKSHSIPFQEVKIKTIYIEDNATSHFNPIVDSIKIYSLIFKFFLSSILSSILDLGIFTVLTLVLTNYLNKRLLIFTATFSARVLSSLFNFTLNRKAVFKTDENLKSTLARYYILCIIQTALSFGLVYFLSKLLGAENLFITVIKIIVDVILYFISFQVQREWVFNKRKK